MNTIVLKFGGSVLRDDGDLPAAVHEVYRHLRDGSRVLAVVSAYGGETDRLMTRARGVSPELDERALAGLLATGEATSAALLALALQRAGVPARSLEPHQIGLDAAGDRLDAEPSGLDVDAVGHAFEGTPVLVVPGFVGRAADGGPALFGRGGSDVTALFLAARLGARAKLVKDVEALFEHDPALSGPAPRRYATVHWDDALALGGTVLQEKAVRFARDAGLPFEVGGLGIDGGTVVASEPSTLAPEQAEGDGRRPLRVGLLGLGTVGLGVYRELVSRPAEFEIVRVLVRDLSKPRGEADLDALVTAEPEDVLGADVDVIVEVAGGVEPAVGWMRRAIESGRHVVTANKAALAEHGVELTELAARHRVRLLASASVGGAVPALEAARALAGDVVGFEGVLNGTTNFVLDEVAAGATFADAVGRAQELGFAEADPTLDLDGTDAAQKLELLARAAFGDDVSLHWLSRSGIEGVDPDEVRSGGPLVTRLVASCHRTDAGLVATVGTRRVPLSDALGRVRGAENALTFRLADGSTRSVTGVGAGRWPTAEAVLADLFDLARPLAGNGARAGSQSTAAA